MVLSKLFSICHRYQHWLLGCLVALFLLGFFYIYITVVDTQMLGFIHDDGIYAITAKALAQGKGYRLIHLISQPPQIKYPIVYPLILSLGWLINPHFPDNLPLLSYITLGFSVAALGVLFVYLRRCHQFPGWLALLVMAMMGSYYYYPYYATTIMSEGPYVLFSLLTLLYAEQHLKQPTLKNITITILLSILTFHTRIVGILLIFAIGAWLLLKKHFKWAFTYLGTSLLFTQGVWQLGERLYSGQFKTLTTWTYMPYSQEFIGNITTSLYWTRVMDCIQKFCFRLLDVLFPMINNAPDLLQNPSFNRNFGYIVLTLVLLFCIGSYYWLTFFRSVRQKQFSIPGLYILFYGAFILLWNYPNQLARFVVVIVPWLWIYFWKPMLPWIQTRKKILGVIVTIVAVPYFITSGLAYQSGLQMRENHIIENGHYPRLWQEYQEVFGYIKSHIPRQEIIAAQRDTVFYLYTGHPVYQLHLEIIRGKPKLRVAYFVKQLVSELDAYHVHYFVAEPNLIDHDFKGPVNPVPAMLLSLYPKQCELLYLSSTSKLAVFKWKSPLQHH